MSKDIKDFLLKEAADHLGLEVSLRDPTKDLLLKEAESRVKQPVFIKEAAIKEEMLSDALLQLAFSEDENLEKEAMAALTGSSYYAGATNVEVYEFPEEEKSRISAIKKNIKERFQHLLQTRLKDQGGKWTKIDLGQLGIDPFYVRLRFVKHLLPANSDPVLKELEDAAPGFSELAKHFDEVNLSVAPYENRTLRQGPRDAQNPNLVEPAKKWFTRMLAPFYAPASNELGINFPTLNPLLKNYWTGLLEYSEDNNAIPPFSQNIQASSYSSAIKVPWERREQVKNPNSLIWAIHYLENKEGHSLYKSFPEGSENAYQAWKTFVNSIYNARMKEIEGENPSSKTQLRYQQKANYVTDKVWNVYGVIPPDVRNIEKKLNTSQVNALNEYLKKINGVEIQSGEWGAKGKPTKLNAPGRRLPPYDRLSSDELHLLLDFFGTGETTPAEIRVNASPRLWPNGLDLHHIYPPVTYDYEYGLDYDRGNFGTNHLRHSLTTIIDILDNKANEIHTVYDQLKNNSDHPIMKSHTAADNLLFFFQNLPTMPINAAMPESEIPSSDDVEGSMAARFVSQLLGNDKTPTLNKNVLTQGKYLFKKMLSKEEDNIPLGYKLAKITDYLLYTIFDNIEDPTFPGVSRNYIDQPEDPYTILEDGPPEQQEFDELFVYQMEHDLGLGNPSAQSIAQNLRESGESKVMKKLLDNGVFGEDLTKLFNNFENIKLFADWVKSPMFPNIPAGFQEEIKEQIPWHQNPPPGAPGHIPTQHEQKAKEQWEKNNPPPPTEASVVDRLVKIADNLDRKGYTKISNKIDLLIAKLGEE